MSICHSIQDRRELLWLQWNRVAMVILTEPQDEFMHQSNCV